MKKIKYTLAALALVAAASFSTAKAQTSGDVVVGIYNGTDSLAFDLGAYSTLTNGEQFNLGNVASLVSGSANFAIVAAAAGDITDAGGITGGDIAFTGIQSQLQAATDGGELSTQESQVNTILGAGFNANQISHQTPGTHVTDVSYELSSASTSFAHLASSSGANFGLGGAAGTVQSYTGSNSSVPYYFLDVNNDILTPLDSWTFSTSGSDTTLTYGALATPEPSAYALGLCALALFWVLKRRSSTIA